MKHSLAGIIHRFHDAYEERCSGHIPVVQQKTIHDICNCRTPYLGGHFTQCDCCKKSVISYHSCKNRFCPTCGHHDSKEWYTKQSERLLNTHYFHVVFTLPHELQDIMRKCSSKGYSLLFNVVFTTLQQVVSRKYCPGGIIAAMGVLHTWTRKLIFHPHIHVLIAGGVYYPQKEEWVSSPPTFLVPERVLSSVFRAIFVKKLRKAFPQVSIPEVLFKKDWVVKVLPALSHQKHVLSYLSRYVKRAPLTNNRIISVNERDVTFRYQDSQTKIWNKTTVTGVEFLRRFLQHTLSHNFKRVRYFGLMSPSYKKALTKVQEKLGVFTEIKKKKSGKGNLEKMNCPVCKKGHLFIIGIIPREIRGPPW